MVNINTSNIKNYFNKSVNYFNNFKVITIFIYIIVIIALISYVSNKLTLRSRGCSNLKDMYEDYPKLSSINYYEPYFNFKLRDYYIKTAYNACSLGDFKNNFVDICSLKNNIKQGYRCLDFEIYSVNNEPVVAASSLNDYNVKQTYNSVPFEEVCKTISSYAFSGANCPNPSDPLLIHLRIMSKNTLIFDKIADYIYNNLSNYVLGKKYSYENQGRNLGNTKLDELKEKVIIMVDRSNTMYEGTKLDEYINIASNSAFMRCVRFDEMRYAPDMYEFIDYNKKNMCIVLPNVSEYDSNMSAALALKYGCQMIGMSPQNYDNNLNFYDNYFNNYGYAFVLKPENLRFKPVTIKMPKLPPKSHSFAEREVKSDFYNFNI